MNLQVQTVSGTAALCKFGASKRNTSMPTWTVRSAKSPTPAHNTWLASGQADGPGSPFAALEVKQEIGGGRRRYKRLGHHTEQLDWVSMFEVGTACLEAHARRLRRFQTTYLKDPAKPLIIDVGCGCGRCLLLLATQQQSPQHRHAEHHRCLPAGLVAIGANLLGVDVSVGIVDQANTWAVHGGLSAHLRYVASDISSVLAQLRSYPGPVRAVAVQFPDPHYRPQRHPVNSAFVRACAEIIEPGGSVWLQSDIESTAVSMRHMFWLSSGDSFAPHPVHYEPGASWHPRGANLSREVRSRAKHGAGVESAYCVGGDEVGTEVQDLWSRHHDAMAGTCLQPSVEVQGETTASKKQVLDGAVGSVQEDCGCGAWSSAGWLVDNVWQAPTEREYYHASVTGAHVYRLLLQKL